MLAAAAGGALVLGAATFIVVAGWSFPGYLYERIETTLAMPDNSGNAFALDFGVVSNAIKIHQARVLLGHIGERPIHGGGFGAVAPDYRYGQIYSYELSYLAVAYKTGVIGLLLFLSFPLRLVIDAARVRLGRIRPALGVEQREAAVPIAVLMSLLAVGATNPYLVASFGLAPIVLMVCWLDPFEVRKRAGSPRRLRRPLRSRVDARVANVEHLGAALPAPLLGHRLKSVGRGSLRVIRELTQCVGSGWTQAAPTARPSAGRARVRTGCSPVCCR